MSVGISEIRVGGNHIRAIGYISTVSADKKIPKRKILEEKGF
jgi:hypothetical protein